MVELGVDNLGLTTWPSPKSPLLVTFTNYKPNGAPDTSCLLELTQGHGHIYLVCMTQTKAGSTPFS